MKLIDFSAPGGFPLTPEVLDFMQASYASIGTAAFADAGLNPTIISGMVIDGVAGELSPGWCLVAGELLYCAGGPIYAGVETYVAVQNTKSSVAYENGTLREVYSNKTLVIVGSGPNALALSTFQHWLTPMAAAARTRARQKTVPFLLVGDTNGTYTIKRDPVTGLVNLKGSFTVTNATAISVDAPFYSIGTALDAECRPLTTVPFAALVRHHSYTPPTESTGKDYIRQINCTVSDTGSISLGLLKAAGPYSASFNILYPTW